MKLNKLKPGESAIIDEIDYLAGIRTPYTLGIIPGATVKCLSTVFTCMEFDLYGQRLILSKELASRYSCTKLD